MFVTLPAGCWKGPTVHAEGGDSAPPRETVRRYEVVVFFVQQLFVQPLS